MSGKAAYLDTLIAELTRVQGDPHAADFEVWIVDGKRLAPATGEVLVDEIQGMIGIRAGDDPLTEAGVAERHQHEMRQYYEGMRVLLERHADYRRWLRIAAKTSARNLHAARSRIEPELRRCVHRIMDAEMLFDRMPLGLELTNAIMAVTKARAVEMRQHATGLHPAGIGATTARATSAQADRDREAAAVTYLRVMRATTAIRMALAEYRHASAPLRYGLRKGEVDEVVRIAFGRLGSAFARLVEVGGAQLAALAQREQRQRWLTKPGEIPGLDPLARTREAILREVERLGRERAR
jgi:hypothetical protein